MWKKKKKNSIFLLVLQPTETLFSFFSFNGSGCYTVHGYGGERLTLRVLVVQSVE